MFTAHNIKSLIDLYAVVVVVCLQRLLKYTHDILQFFGPTVKAEIPYPFFLLCVHNICVPFKVLHYISSGSANNFHAKLFIKTFEEKCLSTHQFKGEALHVSDTNTIQNDDN